MKKEIRNFIEYLSSETNITFDIDTCYKTTIKNGVDKHNFYQYVMGIQNKSLGFRMITCGCDKCKGKNIIGVEVLYHLDEQCDNALDTYIELKSILGVDDIQVELNRVTM